MAWSKTTQTPYRAQGADQGVTRTYFTCASGDGSTDLVAAPGTGKRTLVVGGVVSADQAGTLTIQSKTTTGNAYKIQFAAAGMYPIPGGFETAKNEILELVESNTVALSGWIDTMTIDDGETAVLK